MVYPEKKIGIVCVPINEKGVLRVQLPNKKIWRLMKNTFYRFLNSTKTN